MEAYKLLASFHINSQGDWNEALRQPAICLYIKLACMPKLLQLAPSATSRWYAHPKHKADHVDVRVNAGNTAHCNKLTLPIMQVTSWAVG